MGYGDLFQLRKKTYTVPEIRKMLNLGKTESYWLLKHRNFETTVLSGQIRVYKDSFQKWYDNQVKYHLVDGPPPGSELKSHSYSPQEMAELLEISDGRIYELISRGCFETFVVDSRIRITKESFERWYQSQDLRRTKEDRQSDSEATKNCYSLPDIQKMLGIHRNCVYSMISRKRNAEILEIIVVSGKKYVTIESFEKWCKARNRVYTPLDQQSIAVDSAEKKPAQRSKTQKKPIKSKATYSVDEVAAATGLTSKVLYRMIRRFDIPATKAGNKYFISDTTLKSLLEKGEE